jgi:hypothetical protein
MSWPLIAILSGEDDMDREQLPKDTLTTLADLKRVLEAVGRRPFTDGSDFTTSRLCQWESRRADAWRTAFEWREGLLDRCGGPDEYHEGMALIREKLQS